MIAEPATAQTVVDGDTIKPGGTTYRLWGIDAMESRQTCSDSWPSGAEEQQIYAGTAVQAKAAFEATQQQIAQATVTGHNRPLVVLIIGLMKATMYHEATASE
jgi:endonuclease YncB( thermonuclease family)